MIKKIVLFLIFLKVKSDNFWDYCKKIDIFVDLYLCINNYSNNSLSKKFYKNI